MLIFYVILVQYFRVKTSNKTAENHGIQIWADLVGKQMAKSA